MSIDPQRAERRFGFNEYGVLEWLAPMPDVQAGQVGTIEQDTYRFRFDNGGETSATWMAATGNAPCSAVSIQTLYDGYGGVGSTVVEKRATSLYMTNAAVVTHIMIWAGLYGSPTDSLRVGIFDDSSGEPNMSSQKGGYATISYSQLTSTITPLVINFATPPSLSSGTDYWIVWDRTGSLNASNYYSIGTGGYEPPTSLNLLSGTWTATYQDPSHILWSASYGIPPGTGFRLRFNLENPASKDSAAVGKCQFRECTAAGQLFGAWTDVSASATDSVHGYNSANVTDGAVTTQQIGSGTFMAGEISEDGVVNFAVDSLSDCEIEFCLYFNENYVTPGSFFQFRMVYYSGTEFEAYASNAMPVVQCVTPQWEQDGFRFRNDDGSESTATWMDALNVDVDLAADTDARLRFLITCTNAYFNSGPYLKLEYRLNAGAWQDAGDAMAVSPHLSSYYSHLDDCVQRLGSGTFVAENDGMGNVIESLGAMYAGKSPNSGSATSYWMPGYESEAEFSFFLDSAEVTEDDEVEFRVLLYHTPADGYSYDTGESAFYAYNEIPMATVPSGGTTYYKTLTPSGVGTSAVGKVSTWYRSLAPSGTGTASALTLALDLLRSFSASGIGTPALSRVVDYFRTFAASATGTAAVVYAKLFERTVAVTAAGTAAISKITTWFLTLSPSATGTAAITKALDFLRSFSASGTGTPSMSRVADWYRSFAASATGAAAVVYGKLFERTVAVAAAGTAAISKAATRFLTLSPSAIGTALITKALDFRINLYANPTGTAAFARVVTFYRSLAATATGAVAFSRLFERYLNIAVSAVATPAIVLARFFDRAIAVTVTGAVGITKLMGKIFNPGGLGTPSITSMLDLHIGISTGASGTPSFLKKVSYSIAVAATGAVAMAQVLFFEVAFAATAAGTAVLARVAEYYRSFAATVTGTPGFAREALYYVGLGVQGEAAAAMARQADYYRSIGITVTGTPQIDDILTAYESLGITATGTAAMSYQLTDITKLYFNLTVTAAVSLTRRLYETIDVNATGTPGFAFARFYSRVFAATVTAAVVITKIFTPLSEEEKERRRRWLAIWKKRKRW